MKNDLNLGLFNKHCYSTNNIRPEYNIQKIIPSPHPPLIAYIFFPVKLTVYFARETC